MPLSLPNHLDRSKKITKMLPGSTQQRTTRARLQKRRFGSISRTIATYHSRYMCFYAGGEMRDGVPEWFFCNWAKVIINKIILAISQLSNFTLSLPQKYEFGTSWIGKQHYFASIFANSDILNNKKIKYPLEQSQPYEDRTSHMMPCTFDSDF